MAATPYRIPNKSSAVDIILAGVRGGLSGALSVGQANAQREQMNREFDLKMQGIQLQQESLDQQWNIHLADLDQRNKELLSQQTFDENKVKLSASLQEESAKRDLIRQVGTMALQFQMQNVQKSKEMANENYQKSLDRELDVKKADVQNKILESTLGIKVGTFNLAKQTAAREDRKFEQKQNMDTLGVLKDIATFDKNSQGVDPEIKQQMLDSRFNEAYKNWKIDNDQQSYDNLVSASVQRARNIYLTTRDFSTNVYWYDEKGKPTNGLFEQYIGSLYADEGRRIMSPYVTTPKTESESVKKYKSAADMLLSPAPVIKEFKAPPPAPKKSTDTSKSTKSLPDKWNDFLDILNAKSDAESGKYIKDNKDLIKSKYGNLSDGLFQDVASKPLPVTPTKGTATKGNSSTDIYNKLSTIVNIDNSNPNPVWSRMNIDKLDVMVKSTDRDQLLTVLTTILSRAGNKNPRVTAENIIKNYARMVK